MVDLFVVVRAAGERTEQTCISIAEAQLSPHQVAVVCETPFVDALLKGINLAMARGNEWTLFLDADVLLRADILARMVEEAEHQKPFYMLNFKVLDRGFGGPTYGTHLYTTALFEQALLFADAARSDQRPETRLYKKMAKQGHRYTVSEQLVGIHGFEQFHRDLYRVAFVRATKFRGGVPYLLQTYRDQYFEHDDFKSMFWGLVDGIIFWKPQGGVAPLDVRVYAEQAHQMLERTGLREKDALPVQQGMFLADNLIRQFSPDEAYLANRSWICPRPRVVRSRSKPAAFWKRFRRAGALMRQALLRLVRRSHKEAAR